MDNMDIFQCNKLLIIMDSEYDGRVLVPDGLEQRQRCGGALLWKNRSQP